MAYDLLTQIAHIGMIPVLNIDKVERAIPLAKALTKGGLPLMEVMFRTDAAADSIKAIACELPDFIIGAGTVLTVDQAMRAVDSGAQFLVAPGFNPKVVEWAVDHKMPIVPGTVTPTEVEAARALGVHVLKFFPAVQQGGVPAMGLLSGPYPDVRWVPTGDMTRPLATEYLQFNKVAATGGDFMLKYDDIHADNYEKITHDVEETILDYLNFHMARFGFNTADKSSADTLVSRLSEVFHQKTSQIDGSSFSGSIFECLYKNGIGRNGDLAVGTRDATRAYYYLKRCGVEFAEDTVETFEDGRITSIYLKDDFEDFAIRLVQD